MMEKKKKRILVCDDDGDYVDIVSALLQNNGYEVDVAYNGEEGLQKVKEVAPDLVILDVMMSTRSEGFNVSRELRNSEQTKSIPIIMVTSVNETVPFRFEPDETWLPVDSFLEKPADPKRLLEEVRKKLEG